MLLLSSCSNNNNCLFRDELSHKNGAYLKEKIILDGTFKLCNKDSTLKSVVTFHNGFITELISYGYENEEICRTNYSLIKQEKDFTLFTVKSKEGDFIKTKQLIIGDSIKLASQNFKKMLLKNLNLKSSDIYTSEGQLEDWVVYQVRK